MEVARAPGSVHGSRLGILRTGSHRANRALRRSPRATVVRGKLTTLQARAASIPYDSSEPVVGCEMVGKADEIDDSAIMLLRTD